MNCSFFLDNRRSGYYLLWQLTAGALAFAHRCKNPRNVRLLSIPGDACWLTYNALVGNVVGIFTEIFILSSIFIGLIRLDFNKKLSKAKQTEAFSPLKKQVISDLLF